MKKLIIAGFAALLLTGCGKIDKCLDAGGSWDKQTNMCQMDTQSNSAEQKSEKEQNSHSKNEPQTYNAKSWESIISDECRNIFDGCNRCSRTSKGLMCTKMACATYKKPRCLDVFKEE